MIREQRNREKLRTYYQKFMAQGILDPNVHPWVGRLGKKAAVWEYRPKILVPLFV